MADILGIIAAQGILPRMVADNHSSSSGSSVVACLKGSAFISDYKDHIAEEFSIGSVGSIIKFFKKHNVHKIVICGAIKRPNFSAISVDTNGAILLTKILAAKFLGDDKLLRILAEHIESKGFSIASPLEYTNQIAIKTKAQPSKSQKHDIEIGFDAAQKLGELDIGQAVVVDGGVVIGVEAKEGTDALIKRCKSGILIKSMKPQQDPRLDTPVIGLETIKAVYKSGIDGIALYKVIVLEPEKVIAEADRLGLFIVELK